MVKTTYFVNLCPKKLFWELRQLEQFKVLPEEWWLSPQVLLDQLVLLSQANIQGIKLNIFNSELTQDGEQVNWQPIDTFLMIAEQAKLKIQLCLGPYQYPLWPGIRSPEKLLPELKKEKQIDKNKRSKQFGQNFVEATLKRYGKHPAIMGFYLGNEWHTPQTVEDLDSKLKYVVSIKFMETLTRLAKKHTRRPILFNTNFDASQHKEIELAFKPLYKILKNQFWLGLDIYPSQEQLFKVPQLMLRRKFHTYTSEVSFLREKFMPRLTVSELEAQPWGDGKSWKEQLEKNPSLIENLEKNLPQIVEKYILKSNFENVTFWGSEFWLTAYHLGHPQVLDNIHAVTTQ